MTAPPSETGETGGARGPVGFGAALLALAAVATSIVVPILWGDAPQDDAYISYRYASHFADGHGLVWNPGEPPLEGYTNFLWTLWIGLGMKAGMDPERVVPWVGLALTAATVLVTFALARRLGSSAWFAALGALLFATRPTLTVHAMGGMETPLFGLLVVLGLYGRLGRERTRGADQASSVALALAALTRPEGVLVWGLLELGELLAELRARGLALGSWLRRALLRAVPFVLIVGAHVAWRRATYGDWVPNTFHAKVSPGPATWADGARYAGTGLLFFGPLFLLAPYVVGSAPGFGRARWLCLWVSTLFTLYVVYVGGDYIPSFRFLWPVMPLWSALAAAAASRLVSRMSRGSTGAGSPAPAATAIVSVVFLALVGAHTAHEYLRGHQWAGMHERHARLVAGGRKLDDVLPPDAWIAVTNAGRIPYFAERPTLDMMGLSDAHIARTAAMTETPELAGHVKGDGKYVLDREPEAILFLRLVVSETPLARSREWAQRAKRQAFGVSEQQITEDPRFYRDYRLYSFPAGGGTWLNVFGRTGLFDAAPPDGLLVAPAQEG